MNVLALCSGYGGLEAGLERVLRKTRVVCHVEREAFAAANLAAAMQARVLADAPIWSDVWTFDGKPWRDAIHCVAAGFPCQPFSDAGCKRALDDHRWLWPAIDRIIREVRPGLVVLENVPGVVRLGFDRVLGDLAAGGFDAEWDLFTAAETGAPHRRERLFCVASHPDRDAVRLDEQRRSGRRSRRVRDEGHAVARNDGAARALHHDADGRRLATERRTRRDGRGERRHELDRLGASPWDRPCPQPCVRRMDDGNRSDRIDRLRLLGNGVVPRQAEHAIGTLLGRM